MASSARQWQLHQNRWRQFHRWEKTQPSLAEGSTPTDRLRWCEEALTLHRRFVPESPPILEAEQVRQWRLIRRRLPRRLRNHHGTT